MKNRYNQGGDVDALEQANQRIEMMLANPNAKEFGDVGTSEVVMPEEKPKPMPKAAPKPSPKAAPKSESKPAAKSTPVDVTKLSVAERRKLSRDNPSVSGPTDKRSVNERIRAAFGMKSGGSVSASKRGDGIAQRGKTRGKMC